MNKKATRYKRNYEEMSNFNCLFKQLQFLPRPLGRPNIAEKNPENFVDHKLLDAEGI